MPAFVGPLMAIVVLALIVAIPLAVGRFVLAPVNRTVYAIKAPTRFQLTDLISLMVLIQILLAAESQFVDFNADYLLRTQVVLIVVFPTILMLAMWAGGVSYISQAGGRDEHFTADGLCRRGPAANGGADDGRHGVGVGHPHHRRRNYIQPSPAWVAVEKLGCVEKLGSGAPDRRLVRRSDRRIRPTVAGELGGLTSA